MTVAAAMPPIPRASRSAAGPAIPRLGAGIAILGGWEIVVRLFLPDFVAKPSGIIVAIPHVLGSASFLDAAWVTLAATAEGLAAALILGTAIGLLVGRSALEQHADQRRFHRLHVNAGRVQLGPVTGREQDRFGPGTLRAQAVKDPGHIGRCE